MHSFEIYLVSHNLPFSNTIVGKQASSTHLAELIRAASQNKPKLKKLK